MSLVARQAGSNLWWIVDDNTIVAEIHLDYLLQVDEVVINATTSDEVRLAVLQLAVWHGNEFVRDRTTPAMGGLLQVSRRNPDLSPFDSNRLMSFDLISDEIRALDQETLIAYLRHLGVDVIISQYGFCMEAIEHAVKAVDVPSLRFKVIPQRLSIRSEIVLEFEINKPYRFMFWKLLSRPADEEYHLVPPYHPVMADAKAAGSVNGATDAYLGRKAVHAIYCPKAAQYDRHAKTYGSSWNHLNHPFCASGRSFRMCIKANAVRSEEGCAELTNVLRAALNLGNTYIKISQGFRPPLKGAYNRLNELGRRGDAESHRQRSDRGSEPNCVWEYRTLTDESVIEQSHVPSWVINEGWLEIYRTAEVGPTMY